jgi:CheY-like chemotaxis protein
MAVHSLQASGPALRVLVVDDYPDGADTLAEAVTLLGHRAEVARSPEQALAVSERLAPHVVLLDLGLPRMSGFDLARRLQQLHGHELALIAVTGFSGKSERERAEADGFFDYLLKPIDFAVLSSLLTRLQNAHARRP